MRRMHLRSGSHRAVALVAAIVASVVLTPTIAHATTADAATTVPSAPRGPLIGSGLNSVYAYWWPPDDDGGLPIVSYTVCTSTDPEVPVATSMCTRIGPTVAAWWQIDGLTPLATYYVRVAAENAAGLGAWTAPSKGAVAATVPGPPASVTVEPGIRSVHVSWTPPTFTGGVEVNGWRICAADTAAAPVATKCATKFPTDPHEITLTVEGGRTYGVTVEAGNEAGIGPPSAAVEVAVPVSPPSTPTGAQITAAERAVEVSWTPPAPPLPI